MNKVPKLGSYVLATKWSDGDPGDAWAVGFLNGFHDFNGKFLVGNDEQHTFRINGYSYCAEISDEVGDWLIKNDTVLESSVPGSVNLWAMLGIEPTSYRTIPPAECNTDQSEEQQTRPLTPAEQRAFARDIFLGPSVVDDSKTQLFMESKSEIERRIERSQEALNRPLKDTVKLIPNCPNVGCGIYPGNWCRDCPKHRNNGRAE